jgi:hypothetical protein
MTSPPRSESPLASVTDAFLVTAPTPTTASTSGAFEAWRVHAGVRLLRWMTPLLALLHLVAGELVFRPRGASDPHGLFRSTLQSIHRAMFVVALALVALLWFAARPTSGPRLRSASVLAFSIAYVLFGAVVAANAQRLNGNINTFILVVLLIALVLRLPMAQAGAVFAAAFGAISLALMHTQALAEARVAALVNAVTVALLALLLSVFNRRAAARQFALTAALEQSNAELDRGRTVLARLNDELSERVERQVKEIVQRAEEIDRLNRQLRQSVVEQSRQLRLALSSASPDVSRTYAVGSVLDDRVELLAWLGSGGTSLVFAGYDRVFERRVAVKILRSDWKLSRGVLQRFVAEAEAAGSVEHPGIARPLRVCVSAEGRFYQEYEYVDGRSFEALEGRACLTVGEALRVTAAAADALAAAHARGVIHRDIKPSNLLLSDREPGVFVLDFGIAKLETPGIPGAEQTDEGSVLGTPRYMSPEQVLDASRVTAASDVYSLALVLRELLREDVREPLSRETLMLRHLRGPAPSIASVAGVSDDVRVLFDAMVSIEPEQRPTADRVADVLRAAADRLGAPSPTRTAARCRGSSALDVRPPSNELRTAS